MKLTKKAKVTADTIVVDTQVPADVAEPSVDNSASKYGEAVDHIKAAIESLGVIAADDDLARDSIANLSVVLFDLAN